MATAARNRLSTSSFYAVYGLTIASEWRLPVPAAYPSDSSSIELLRAPASFFTEPARRAALYGDRSRWFIYHEAGQGSYLAWPELFEFFVTLDGRRIYARALSEATEESFLTYLLGHVLSFALLQQGVESLHATVVAVKDRGIAFVAPSGLGKSTLAATLLAAGHKLVTDDLLVLRRAGDELLAMPGVPRIKLFPTTAEGLLPEARAGAAMHHLTSKLVLPVPADSWAAAPVPLKAIYQLSPSEGAAGICIETLSGQEAYLALLANTFNRVVLAPERLRRQMAAYAKIANAIPVARLHYPRDLSRLSEVRDAIIAATHEQAGGRR